MDLAQTRLVTSDVAALARFYAQLVDVDVVVNDYYVEVPTRVASIAFSRKHFVEPDRLDTLALEPCDRVILDFVVDDVDRHYSRVDQFGVAWLMPPTTQPWGSRSMMFRDPEGAVVNVYSRSKEQP